MKRVSRADADKEKMLTAGEKMTLEEKYAFLKELGRPDLVEIFKDYRSKRSRSKPKSAPLDQRVAISITPLERIRLTKELAEIKAKSGQISISQYIRNKATKSIDIQDWREKAEAELDRLSVLESSQKDLRKRRADLILSISEGDFEGEDLFMREREIVSIDTDLAKLIAKGERRSNRLNGRMTMKEAEVVRWRAEQLFISVSDYLRIVLFDFFPGSAGDSHMGLEARKRFYASIIRISMEGWGSPPNIYECGQCAHYVEEIRVLQDRVEQLETFV